MVDQLDDPSSTLHLVRDLIRLRRETPALRTRASQEVVNDGYPFAYVRGGTHLVIVNPRRDVASLTDDRLRGATVLLGSRVDIEGDTLTLEGFGYAVLALRYLRIRAAQACSALASSRRNRRRILPDADFGISSVNTT